MKIGQPADSSVAAAAAGTPAAPTDAAKSAQAAAVKDTAAGASAKVELSSTAATLLSPAGAAADFDADKVKRMSDAIASGTFAVNADVIADKLIANARELLAKVSG